MAAEVEKKEPVKQQHIGIRIKQIRLRENLTQARFAESLGIGQPSLSRIEKGEVQPSMEVVRRIADKYCKRDMRSLLKGTTAAREWENVLELNTQVWAYCPNDHCPEADIWCRNDKKYGTAGYFRFVPAFDEEGEANNFCDLCGTKLVRECPECGRKVKKPYGYCSGCGHAYGFISVPYNPEWDETDPFANQ